ncbi:MAG: hypothetical protein K9K82_10845 [Desulfobacteraceae bacterium]|nr:hypothetical protein [Desulfobacteraceae bacterium]
MNVSYRKRFLKDLDKIPGPAKDRVQDIVFEQIPPATGLQDIESLKKIQGFSGWLSFNSFYEILSEIMLFLH